MRAVLLVGALLVAGASVALAVPRGELSGLLDLTGERLPAPPELRLLSPSDGEGVAEEVTVAGLARSAARDVIDVQVRVDAGRWTSVPDVARGRSSVPFSLTLTLARGDHLIEARAWDGEAYSLPAQALVRRDAPTVRIAHPTNGAGVESGIVEITGTVHGPATEVVVDAGEQTTRATLLPGGAWSARLQLAAGIHELRAKAEGPVPSLPALVRVAAGEPAPASLTILAPHEGASYGEAGDLACGGGCIVFSGTSRDAERIAAAIDGFPAGNATLLPTGAWTFRVPMVGLASGPHVATFAPAGGIAHEVRFLARTPLELGIRGDDAPRATLVPLSFRAVGESADAAEWALDGRPFRSGPTVAFSLAHPGDHTLQARTLLPNGRAATASLALHAFNRAPTVELAEPLLVGADIHLQARASDADGRITAYRWEFGDGTATTTSAPAVAHRYASRGVHLANVTAVDDRGALAQASVAVLVANVAPIANFSWDPPVPTVLDVVTLRDESVDLDGELVGRTWLLPNGGTSDNATPSLRLLTRGAHPITLDVVDELGETTRLTRVIEVANLPPIASFSWEPLLPSVHEEVFFIDRSTDADGPIGARAWDLGDGSHATGTGALHAYRAPGLYNVTLQVVDDMGLGANVTLPLRVVDAEPTVTAVVAEPPRPRSHEAVTLRVLATDREGGIAALWWDFGDGNRSNEREPTHRYARAGLYAGRVSVTDEGGLSTDFPFTIDVANAPPVATIALASGGYAAFPSTLVATATDPDGRVALYRFDADGDGATDCETTAPTCTFTYAQAGAHLARVWVEDDAAEIVEAQTLLEIGMPPSHLAPPIVTIASPTEGAQMRGDHLIRGDATSVRPITRVELQFRNENWAYSGTKDPWRVANGGLAWSALVDTRSFADGGYDLVVRATDEGGGQGYARLPIRVENGARASEINLQLLDPPALVAEDAALRGSAFHPQGVTSVRWRIDDESWRYISTSPLAFTIPIEFAPLDPGDHTLTIEAYRGPTEKTALQHDFRVPGETPTLIVDEPPAPTAHALLRASGRILGEGHAQWRLDHHLWRDLPGNATWTLHEDTLDVAGGEHVLELRAVSPDDRLASEPARYEIVVINPPFFDAGDEPPRPSSPLVTVDVPTSPILALLALALALALRRR